MTSYYDLTMHDPKYGAVSHLCSSNDGAYLYSCGTDGNVFSFRVDTKSLIGLTSSTDTLRTSRVKKRSTFISGTIPKDAVMDVCGETEPSLEQTKRDAERLNQQKLTNERKESIRRKLLSLKLKFDFIISRNNMLPDSQVLPQSQFELDPRITAARQEKIDTDMALMLRQIAFKVARSHLLVKKMQNHFVDKIASLDVTVRAIKKEELAVKAFTHNKLTEEFLQAEREMQMLLQIKPTTSAMTMDTSSQRLGSVVTVVRQSVFEHMIRAQPFYNKLPLKARKALLKRNAMRAKKDRRTREWQVFLETKPEINKDDPGDTEAFELALETIGDFKLKSANDFRVPEDKRVTPAQKYWQIQQLHREIFETKEAFNTQVCNIRDAKISLVRRFKQLYHDLDTIQQELSPQLHKARLPIPKCYLKNNFPDHIFRLEFGDDPLIYEPVSALYDEECAVLRVKVGQPVSTEEEGQAVMRWSPSLTHEQLQSLGADDAEDTPWEHQLKVRREIRLLHEQNTIIAEMEESTNRFDEALEHLSIDRLRYARDIKLMEVFRLTLYQELVVINSYAGQEEAISEKIHSGVKLRNERLRQKISIQENIEVKQMEMVFWQTKLSELQEDVSEKLTNNKFYSFLNRIFKKKKAVKRASDSNSETSSSEDLTDEEFEEEDNEDYVPIKLDENICPEGCDPHLFEDIIHCRNQRYDIEENMAELRRQLDEHQKELQICNKDLTKVELEVSDVTQELEKLQFEKQQKLNNIETVIVLNLSQFRHFCSASHPEEGLVQNPLVFHSEALITLAGRVRELERELEAEEIKIKQQKVLMQQLDKKRKEMKEIKKEMKKEIDEETLRKFGELIDVELMEETVLRRMISQARKDHAMVKLQEKYHQTIQELKTHLWHRTEVLIREEKENTRRLKLQTMLEQEAGRLRQLLRHQRTNKDKIITLTEEESFDKDVKHLEAILNDQMEYQKQLNEEIRILSYKCTPPSDEKKQRPVLGEGDATVTADLTESAKMDTEDTDVSGIVDDYRKEEGQTSTEAIVVIDKILRKLASGSSTDDVARSIIEELLHSVGNEEKISSAMECAMKLVEELILVTTQEDAGDVSLVEQYTDYLLKITSTEHELNVIDVEDDLPAVTE